jgi:glycosyltransferase involved in cell wall biosynthesis
MEPILVSAVIPAYNAELYLEEAIESVLAQTYKTVELIVVDDGSTDDTALIAKKFGDSVHLIRQTNRGLSGARNTGIRNAQGEIIALLDADDLWEPNFLEEMVSGLEKSPHAAGAYCGFQYINKDGNVVGKPSLKVVDPDVFHETLRIGGNWLVPSGVIFWKSYVFKVGLFDESLRALEDVDMWIRLSVDHPFIGLPVPLVKYRRHESNMSKDPQHMITASRLLTEKRVGPLEGEFSSWPESMVYAYCRHFHSAAIRYLTVGNYEKSVYYLCQLAGISLDYLYDIGLWRGLARAHVPDEYQFDSSLEFNWTRMQSDIENLLAELKKNSNSQPNIHKHYARIKASAFLALADEAGRAGNLRLAYRWLWTALRSFSLILLDRRLWGIIFRSLTAR